jgi:hypothetical protein
MTDKATKFDLRKIRVVAKSNPYREGTNSHLYLETARKAKTYGQFKEAFKPGKIRRNAMVGLSISIRAGHVRIA